MNTIYSFPQPENEKVLQYKSSSPERAAINTALAELQNLVMEVPVIIDGMPVYTDNVVEICAPHDNKKVIARVHMAGEKQINAAIHSSLKAKESWMRRLTLPLSGQPVHLARAYGQHGSVEAQ